MSTMTVRMDGKGRLVAPKEARDALGAEEGDVFYVEVDAEHGTLLYARAENPLLKQLAESVADYQAGRYQTLEEVAAELGVDLDGE